MQILLFFPNCSKKRIQFAFVSKKNDVHTHRKTQKNKASTTVECVKGQGGRYSGKGQLRKKPGTNLKTSKTTKQLNRTYVYDPIKQHLHKGRDEGGGEVSGGKENEAWKKPWLAAGTDDVVIFPLITVGVEVREGSGGGGGGGEGEKKDSSDHTVSKTL